MPEIKKDTRKVRFNLAIPAYRDKHPGYRHNEVVNYADMPPGHQFWVDNKSIIGSTLICGFIEDEPKPVEPVEPEKKPAEPVIEEKQETHEIVQSEPEIEESDLDEFNEDAPQYIPGEKEAQPETEKKRRGRPKKNE